MSKGFSESTPREILWKHKKNGGAIVREDGSKAFNPIIRRRAIELIAFELEVAPSTIDSHILMVTHTKSKRVEFTYKDKSVMTVPINFNEFIRNRDYMEVED